MDTAICQTPRIHSRICLCVIFFYSLCRHSTPPQSPSSPSYLSRMYAYTRTITLHLPFIMLSSLRSYCRSPQMSCRSEWARPWLNYSTPRWCVLHFASHLYPLVSFGSPRSAFTYRVTREYSRNCRQPRLDRFDILPCSKQP